MMKQDSARVEDGGFMDADEEALSANSIVSRIAQQRELERIAKLLDKSLYGLDKMLEDSSEDLSPSVKRIALYRRDDGWFMVVTGELNGVKVVAFRDLSCIAEFAEGVRRVVSRNKWQPDKPFVAK